MADQASSASDPEVWNAQIQRNERFNRAMATAQRPVTTPILIAVNVAVFIAMAVNGFSFSNAPAESFLRWGADFGPVTTHGEWWRIVTAAFVHAGFLHLLVNMIILWNIGMFTERLFGRVAFTVLYLFAAVGGDLASLAWQPFTVAMGASGAIFGLYGGLLAVLLLHRNSVPRPRMIAIGKSAAVFMAMNLVYGLTQTNVDMAADFGGLVTGFLLGCGLIGPLVPADPDWRQPRSLVVALAGTVVAVLLFSRFPVYDDWRSDLNRLIPLDVSNQRIYNGALRHLQLHQITTVEFAAVIDKQMMPPWNAEQVNLSRLKLSQQQRSLADQLAKYMSLRGEAWSLMEQAVATTDPVMIRRSYQVQTAAESALKAINRQFAPAHKPDGSASRY